MSGFVALTEASKSFDVVMYAFVALRQARFKGWLKVEHQPFLLVWFDFSMVCSCCGAKVGPKNHRLDGCPLPGAKLLLEARNCLRGQKLAGRVVWQRQELTRFINTFGTMHVLLIKERVCWKLFFVSIASSVNSYSGMHGA